MASNTLDKPVLQIIHISDLHIHMGATPQHDGLVRTTIAKLANVNARVGRWLIDYWEDGRAGHATDALMAFEAFLTGQPLPQEPVGTPRYPSGVDALHLHNIPTWLVDTGDLASVGDDKSITFETAWVDRMARLMGAQQTVRIYGNHDAWPDKFPLIANKKEISDHRSSFRTKFFPASFPVPPTSIPIGTTGHRIDLYKVNSVVHDRMTNARARGVIGRDPAWGGTGSKDQLAELENFVVHRAASMSGRAFRILLSHHPIHYPPPKPLIGMTLKGGQNVANQLLGPRASNTGPLAHLVLSGHTHALYPTFGGLPADFGLARHPPLGLQQLQLVVGSLSKAVRHSTSNASTGGYSVDAEPHQFQVLRFFSAAGHPDSIVLKRAFVGRNNGTGRFMLLRLPNGAGVWETSVLNF